MRLNSAAAPATVLDDKPLYATLLGEGKGKDES